MRTMVALAASLWILGTGAAAAQEHPRPISDEVADVDRAAHTITLSDGEYFVPPATLDLQSVKRGDHVVVQWEDRGSRRVALHVDHRPAGAD